jgi:hypothetical protein
MKCTGVGCVIALGVGAALVRGEDSKAKPTIKEIMKTTHKGDDSMVKLIAAGKGTPKQISEILADYKVLIDLEPPRGTKEDWKERTGKVIAATEALEAGNKSAVATFKTATTCKNCHELHKPPKKPA